MKPKAPASGRPKAASEEGVVVTPHVWVPGGRMDDKHRTVCSDCGELWEHANHTPSRRPPGPGWQRRRAR